MSKTETLDNNANYVQVVINNGRKPYLPLSLEQYFKEYTIESNNLVRILTVSKNAKTKQLDDNRYTMVLTIAEPYLPKQFEELMDLVLVQDILPYLEGNKIITESITYCYSLPEGCYRLACGGDITATIYEKSLSPYLIQLLANVFGLCEDQIESAGDMMEMIGSCKIENCLKTENRETFDYLMNKFGVNYELNK